MVTEDYVNFETAKLLKEKGFNISCRFAYTKKGNEFNTNVCCDVPVYAYKPTLQMAMKWLREVHNIHIEIRYNRYSNKYHYKIIYGPTELDAYVSKPHVLRTYEEAAEESIKHCLEMLVKQQ